MVLKRALYGSNAASNSLHKYFVDFIIDLGYTPSRAYQDLCIHISGEYEGYTYIATHVDDIIIADKNPSKYMHYIEIHFKVRDITDSPNYYLLNELILYSCFIKGICE